MTKNFLSFTQPPASCEARAAVDAVGP